MNRGEVEELVQTTVRKMNTGPEACLTNPRVLSFFNIMKDSFYRCLKNLAASTSTPEEKLAAYQGIASWPPARVAEEVELIMKRYPSVKDSYMYVAVYIVEQTYKKDNGHLKLKLPSFQSFMYTFYTTLLQSEPMQQGTFDGLQFFEKEMLCCQAFCNALYNSIRTEPVIKTQSVTIEPSAIGDATSKMAKTASSRVGGGASASRVSGASAVGSQIASASRFSRRALAPHDSVSQLRRPTAESKQENFQGLLTEEFLNKHRQMMKGGAAAMTGGGSPSSEAAASIKKAASKKQSVRVVDIVEHPQKQVASEDTSDSSTDDSSGHDDDKTSFAFHQYSRVDPTILAFNNTAGRGRSRERYHDHYDQYNDDRDDDPRRDDPRRDDPRRDRHEEDEDRHHSRDHYYRDDSRRERHEEDHPQRRDDPRRDEPRRERHEENRPSSRVVSRNNPNRRH